MKTMKHFAGLLLALVMLLALATNVFAADPEATTGATGTITVVNPTTGTAYTAYKIFDVDYNTDKSAVTYTISTDSDWYAVVKNYAEKEGSGLTLQAVANDTTRFTVVTNKDFSAANFSNHLKQNVDGKTGTPLRTSEDGKTVSASSLPLGYYFVTSSTGALCNLTTTTPTAEIYDKNDVPFTKNDDATTVEVGQTVNYVLTGKVPDTTGFAKYTYTISDTMSEGLTFNKDVKVTVGGAELAADAYELTNNTNGFTLAIKAMQIQDKVGQEIKVAYSAVTNDAAVAQISTNTAKLTYSNDPTTDTTTDITVTEKVYSAKIVIDKHETGKENVKLSGAKFLLKNADGKYYKYTTATAETPAKVEWIDTKEGATEVVTDSNGAAEFNGLTDGIYKLEETKAPAGYNLLTADVEITINGEGATENNLTPLTATAKVANSTGTTLPATGGIGTTLFYVFGGLLVLGAAILLVVKKRMSLSK